MEFVLYETSHIFLFLETKCWTPAHFAMTHNVYANAVCEDQIRRNITLTPTEDEPTIMETDSEATLNDVITGKPKEEYFVFLVLCGEVGLLILFYFLTLRSSDKVDHDADAKLNEAESHGQDMEARTRFVDVFLRNNQFIQFTN